MKILLVKQRLQRGHYVTKTCLSTLDLGQRANRKCTLYRVFGFYIDALDLEERLGINIHSYISSKSSFSFFILKCDRSQIDIILRVKNEDFILVTVDYQYLLQYAFTCTPNS